MAKKKYEMIASVEFNNCQPFLYRIVSSKKITLNRVVKYFEKTEDFNPVRDSIQLFTLSDFNEIDIDCQFRATA